MPYDATSTNAAWSLLNRLAHVHHVGQDSQNTSLSIAAAIPSMNAPAEAVFLLTSLSNMAISRSKEDKGFIEVAVKNILEVSLEGLNHLLYVLKLLENDKNLGKLIECFICLQ